MVGTESFTDYGMVQTGLGHEMSAGMSTIRVGPSDAADGSYKVEFFSDLVDDTFPYQEYENLDAATALAVVRSAVNGVRFEDEGTEPDDGFDCDGEFVVDPFETTRSFPRVSDPVTEYGDAYVQWRDSPPVNAPAPRP